MDEPSSEPSRTSPCPPAPGGSASHRSSEGARDARRGAVRRTWGAARRAALLALCLSAAACAGQPDASDEGGFGLPVQPSDAPLPGAREDVIGTLRVESTGCFTLELDEGARPWVIWPPGASQEGGLVILPGGEEVGDGDRLLASGAFTDADELPGWSDDDGYLHAFGTFCGADERGVVLLDRVGSDER